MIETIIIIELAILIAINSGIYYTLRTKVFAKDKPIEPIPPVKVVTAPKKRKKKDDSSESELLEPETVEEYEEKEKLRSYPEKIQMKILEERKQNERPTTRE